MQMRKLISGLLLLCFIFVISSCKNVKSDASPSASAATGEPSSSDTSQATTQKPSSSAASQVIVEPIQTAAAESELPAVPKPVEYKAVIDALENQVDTLLAGQEIALPDGYTVLDHVQGDIGNDGRNDVVIVLEKGLVDDYDFEDFARTTFILTQSGESYKYSHMNEGIVLSSGSGGVFGDPYAGIDIGDGDLWIYDYGGSSWKWSHSYNYKVVDESLILIKIYIENLNPSSNGTSETYDLTNGTVELWFNFANNEDSLLLYKGVISTDKPITFDDFGDSYDCIEKINGVQPWYVLPNVEGYYAEEFKDYREIMKYIPSYTLDEIKVKYYPDMQKVYLPLSDEMLSNYSTLLGYQTPSYYYTDGKSILKYYDYSEQDGVYRHKIVMSSTNLNDYEKNIYYEISDTTGEEILS